MTIVKAQTIIPILLGQGLFPQIIKNLDGSITLALSVSNADAVDSATLQTFAVAQAVSVKATVVIIT